MNFRKAAAAAVRSGLLYLFIVTLLLIGGSYYQSSSAINQIRVEQSRQHVHILRLCSFYRDLGDVAAVPVTIAPGLHKPSKIGIAALADSRTAFRGLGCAGVLRQPSSSFKHWATAYGLPSN